MQSIASVLELERCKLKKITPQKSCSGTSACIAVTAILEISFGLSSPIGQSAQKLLLLAVVDNLPKVPQDKYDKLSAVLKKVYGQIATVREGTAGKFCGCCQLHH